MLTCAVGVIIIPGLFTDGETETLRARLVARKW